MSLDLGHGVLAVNLDNSAVLVSAFLVILVNLDDLFVRVKMIIRQGS